MDAVGQLRGRRPAHGEPVLDRAFRILTAFGPDRSLSLSALSVRAALPKPTALRLARKLTELGALERTETGEYVVGLRLLEVASLAPRGHGLRATALPYMEDLHIATGQHVLLAVRDGSEAILIERLSARGAGRVMYRVGGRLRCIRPESVSCCSRTPRPHFRMRSSARTSRCARRTSFAPPGSSGHSSPASAATAPPSRRGPGPSLSRR